MKKYKSILDLKETEIAIKFVKDNFEKELSKKLNLTRVSAPLFVYKNSGLNDNLNGYERPVSFDIKNINGEVEVVQSLAKWKRMALKKYDFECYQGLYTDMNAIRRDEDLDYIHSCYVDQWDWEKIISKKDRDFKYLKSTVNSIYKVFLKVSKLVNKKYPTLKNDLPNKIEFISTSKLEKMYPNLSRKEREKEITKKYKAVFLYQIGWPLKDNMPHDGRASDYDDWNLNGDILLYYDELDIALELSSMGIRVDEESIIKQIEYKKEFDKLNNPYVKSVINKELPYTIGGGIGQSRICMFFLKKHHIGEVQASIWDNEYLKDLENNENIKLL